MARSLVGPLVGRITDTTEAFWNSPYYFPVTLAVTAVSILTGNVVPSTVALALLCGWMLMFCRDILAAVTIATLLGGLGTIPAKEYFSPLSLYYTLGLGLGLLVT